MQLRFFRELLDSMTPVEARDRTIGEIGGVAVAEEEDFSYMGAQS